MDDFEEENRGGEGEGIGGRGRGGYIQTYRHTYIPSDELGPRGAFAPKNTIRSSVKQNDKA